MPFTYLVGWSSINRFYYGVRYGKKSTPDTLWTTYFTSSKDVKEHREKFGEPDVIQVRKRFESPEKARRWEFKVLRRLKAASSVKWLNRREAPAIPTFSGAANPMSGRKHKPSTLQILSEKAKARKMNADQLRACSERNSGARNPFFGRTHSAKSINKIRRSRAKQNGHNCPSAKSFLFTDPRGNQFTITGGFDAFCKSNNLSRTKMHLAINKGPIEPFVGNNMTTQNTKNCVGWSVSTIQKPSI